MISIFWKYIVTPEGKAEFENEYGPKGTWSALFKCSKDYLGSTLYKSQFSHTEYLLIDSWTSKDSYERFLTINKDQYERLSARFGLLIQEEVKMGIYLTVEEAPTLQQD